MAGVNEVAAAAVEEVGEEAFELADNLRQLSVKASAGAAAVAALAGAFAGYAVAVKRVRTKYEQLAEDEIEQMREHFQKKVLAMEGKPALDGLVEDLGYVPAAEGGDVSEPSSPPEIPQPELKNVFENTQEDEDVVEGDGWDYEAEKARRDPKKPYIIHQDEHGEAGHTEVTFVYYEADDVLCDERDKVVDSRDEVVGDCLDKFGYGSSDRNVVYVRNETIAVDFEIVRSPNSYAQEVHGLRHEDAPPRRALRKRELYDDE